MTDRAELEGAIAFYEGNAWQWTLAEAEAVGVLARAARAHLETLPKTKMVEVWWVECAINGSPHICCTSTRKDADEIAQSYAQKSDIAVFTCVKITGPHLHEVPST